MSEQRQDYIMRQIQSVAVGIGKFLGIQQIKAMLIEEIGEGTFTDEQLETYILIAQVKEIMSEQSLNNPFVANKVGLTIARLKELLEQYAVADEEERDRLSNFVDKHLNL